MEREMIQIKISKDCQSWGQCVFDAPEVFQLVDSERQTWSYQVENSLKDKIKNAALNCPNRAISFREVND